MGEKGRRLLKIRIAAPNMERYIYLKDGSIENESLAPEGREIRPVGTTGGLFFLEAMVVMSPLSSIATGPLHFRPF